MMGDRIKYIIIVKSILIFLVLYFYSCNNKISHDYYENGKIKRTYQTTNEGKFNGKYLEYFNNGKLKQKHYYVNGVKRDTSFYFDSISNKKYIEIWKYDTIHQSIFYNKEGLKIREGLLHNKNNKFRIGKWHFYDYKKRLDSVVEYLNIDGMSYTNQIWLINLNNNDTLHNRGNYFKILLKDTISLGEIVKFRIALIKENIDSISDIEVILPYRDKDLKYDYSNIYEIKRDTFLSLKNDGYSNDKISKHVVTNHIAEFGLEYETPGKKRLRGVLIEYMQGYTKKDSSIRRYERRLFFDKYFYIKKR